MKKVLLGVGLAFVLILTYSCNNNSQPERGTHIHEDGSTHSDHDTTKPVQEEFNVTDSTDEDTSNHIHTDGEKHSH